MYLIKVLIRFQHDLFSIHVPFTTIQIFDAGIPPRELPIQRNKFISLYLEIYTKISHLNVYRPRPYTCR